MNRYPDILQHQERLLNLFRLEKTKIRRKTRHYIQAFTIHLLSILRLSKATLRQMTIPQPLTHQKLVTSGLQCVTLKDIPHHLY